MEALLEKLRAGLSARLGRIAPRGKRNASQLHQLPPEAQASLYVHWPYCEKRCSYCNFNKYIPRNLDELRMKNCLIQEAQTLIHLSEVQRITSVYFGGGTPSLASPLTIDAILDTVSQCVHLAEGAEVTLEANPASADALCLSKFQKAGVNRLSIGIQSLDNAELKLLGRNHTACDALRTLEEAKKLFPGRTSIDLIFGLPGQTVASWIQGLEKALAVCDDHVSLYQLTLERGTSLFKEGAFSTHNLSYWQGSQYIGIGPGAHGRFVPRGDGKIHREARIQTLEPEIWMKEVLAFGHGTRKQTPLRELDILEEVLMLGLRMDIGITHQHWLQFAPSLSLWDVFGEAKEVKELEEHGFLFLDDRGLRCSWKGLAVLDSLLLRLLKQLQQTWMERERGM
ncbi:radical S-adenosyl methionine domain-containing protein 1, mitochondrial isoform 2-T2 [Vipera latastei]